MHNLYVDKRTSVGILVGKVSERSFYVFMVFLFYSDITAEMEFEVLRIKWNFTEFH